MWSEAEVETVRAALLEGLSARQIAERVRKVHGRDANRNQVVGLVHRRHQLIEIGFRGPRTRASSSKKREAQASPAKTRRTLPRKPEKADPRPCHCPPLEAGPVDVPAPKPLFLPLAELGTGCKWAVNDAAPGELHLFCGAARQGLGPYCPHHAARAFEGVWKGPSKVKIALVGGW